LKSIARSLTGLIFSRLMKFIAKAAIPDAEEAIPNYEGKYSRYLW
jgi:hypothetical protein